MTQPPELPRPNPSDVVEGPAAVNEAAAAFDDLSDQEGLNRRNDLRRSDKLSGHINLLLTCGVYFLGVVAAAMIGCVAWNYATPARWRFLDDNVRADLQGFLGSGVLGSFLTVGANHLAGARAPR